jgi:hypothetical protein
MRDTALAIEENWLLGLKDALNLMEMSLTFEPNGPLIRKKISEWNQKLEQSDE